MIESRAVFLEWLTPLLEDMSTQTLLQEPDQDWDPPCWKVWFLDETPGHYGHWKALVQMDYYRDDGDTVTSRDDIDKLTKAMGFKHPAAKVTIPRTDTRVPMVLSLLGGNGWRPGETPTVNPKERHFVLSLELVYGKP